MEVFHVSRLKTDSICAPITDHVRLCPLLTSNRDFSGYRRFLMFAGKHINSDTLADVIGGIRILHSLHYGGTIVAGW